MVALRSLMNNEVYLMSTPITPLSAARLLLSTLLKRTSSKSAPEHTRTLSTPPLPPADDHEAWKVYWKAQGHPWRTEPEIDEKRREYLAQRRIISPDIEHGIYPFKDIKLNRADVEWLLATHNGGRGPINWNDEKDRERVSLDLRGANLRQVNPRDLPLARLWGGLELDEQITSTTKEQRNMAAVVLGETSLRKVQLQGANLIDAQLQGAELEEAQLQEANLRGAQLQEASLFRANLQRTNLITANLQRANLSYANLQGAYLRYARLEDANLIEAQLQGAELREAHLQNADLREAWLEGANLSGIILGNEQHIGPRIVDVRWGDINLAVVNWSQVQMLGDEDEARKKWEDGVKKNKSTRLYEYQRAVRANRQLAIVLQSQGLNEEAARFAYRAQALQKRVSWFQMVQQGVKLGQRFQALRAWLFSWFLFLLAGYGYKPARSFLAYLLVISTFMVLYLFLDPHLAWYEALVVSLTAFHGRGFSPSTFSPGDPLSIASAIEAFVGLMIEVTFISTLTQRFFNR